jgi:glycine dehydrogenase subunit 1
MKYRYLPDTKEDQEEMLRELNLSSTEELFADIPPQIRLNRKLNIPEAIPEPQLVKHMRQLGRKNWNADEYITFLGAGVYDHYIPSVVRHMISRSEFYTAYTPYQPEVSQGELQAMFEFQSMVCELTGLEVANSSMYDGHTALAEAASLAVATLKNRSKILVSKAVHPESRQILQTMAKGRGYTIEEISLSNDVTDLEQLIARVDENTAACIIQYPNFFGSIEDLTQIKNIIDEHNTLLITSCNPLALALLKPPGQIGADIVVGDMQPFGIPMSFGGPHCGYFAVSNKLVRNIPGRIVGQTVDEEGKRGFVLTLQAREQHIRREKASSNICSNQALNALAAAVCMSALGKNGTREMAQLNFAKADYMANRLKETGFSIFNQAPFFNEFVIELPLPTAEINKKLLDKGIIGGYDLSMEYGWEKRMLVAVTEQRSKAEIDQFIDVLEELCYVRVK